MKKGISLIVLVITIIVMIILAASVVITLSNTGVIDRASNAVKLTDEKQVQDLAALVWAEAYLDETRTEPIEDVVKDKLREQGVTEDKWNIEITNTSVVVSAKTEDNSGYTVSGIWLLNDTIHISSSGEWEQTISFTSNGTSYTKIAASFPEVAIWQITYDSFGVVLDHPRWSWEATGVGYRTIDFGSAPQEVSEEFYNWITTNAIKQ